MPAKSPAVALTAALVLFGLVALPLGAAAQTTSVLHADKSGSSKTPTPEPTSSEDDFSVASDDEDDSEDKATESPKPSPTPSPTKKPKEEDHKTPSPTPKPTEDSTTPEPKPSASVVSATKTESHDDKTDLKPHDEAHDETHEISTPPVLIRPQSSGTSGAQAQGSGANAASKAQGSDTYVSAPLGFYLNDQPFDSDRDAGSGVTNFDTSANPPVIENIVATGYATPADEFMAKSYFGLGVLALAAGLLSFKAFGRRNRDLQ